MHISIYMILWNKLPLSLRQHDLSHSCVATDMARHKKGNFSVGCILLSKLSHLPYLMMHNVYAYHFPLFNIFTELILIINFITFITFTIIIDTYILMYYYILIYYSISCLDYIYVHYICYYIHVAM